MFAGAEAEGYDAKIRARVPGYEAMHEIVAATLVAAVPAGGHVLVVGADGGEELVALAKASPTWTFTALDPAADMIALAQQRVACAGVGDRVRFHTGLVADLPEPPWFDAATASWSRTSCRTTARAQASSATSAGACVPAGI